MFIVKVYRQHNSLVMSIPPLIQRSLKICAGDYVELDDCSEFSDIGMVYMTKLEKTDVGAKRNKSGGNKGRRT